MNIQVNKTHKTEGLQFVVVRLKGGRSASESGRSNHIVGLGPPQAAPAMPTHITYRGHEDVTLSGVLSKLESKTTKYNYKMDARDSCNRQVYDSGMCTGIKMCSVALRIALHHMI